MFKLRALNSHWIETLTHEVGLYSTMKNVNCAILIPGRWHTLPTIQVIGICTKT